MLFHIRQHAQKVTVDFMRVVNQSSREERLTCSFVDEEITQFTQIQEASGQAPQEICCTVHWTTDYTRMYLRVVMSKLLLDEIHKKNSAVILNIAMSLYNVINSDLVLSAT